MINTIINPNNINMSLLEQYQLFQEVQRAKREIRVEATIELAKHERHKANPPPLAPRKWGSNLDVIA